MWRFILVTFAFLGWSFYELSGGADYQPGARSLQAHMTLGKTRPLARPEPIQVAALQPSEDAAQAEEDVTRTVTTLTDLSVQTGDRVQVVLAAANADEPALPEAGADEVKTKAEILTEPETAQAEPATAQPEPETVAANTGDRTPALTMEEFVAASLSQRATLDIRWVDRDLVNMRDGPGTDFAKVAQLTRGTEVEILDEPGNGWVMLEVKTTGEIGWMADWLLSPPS